ncbi:Dead deah box rna [Globisporangium polare]
MEDGGFVLNIAASSGAGGGGGGRPAKKKNSFRAKQTAKRAKFKATKASNKTQQQQQVTARTSSSSEKPSTSAGTSSGSPKKFAKPVDANKQQAKAAAPATKKNATDSDVDDNKPPAASAKKASKRPLVAAVPVTTTAVTASDGVETEQAADVNDLSRFDSGSESDDNDDNDDNDNNNQPPAVADDDSDDVGNDDNDDNDESEKEETNAPEAADADSDSETTVPEAAAVPATDAAASSSSKGFGTRRNPNKEAYDPEDFTKVRTKIVDTTTVLDKPLESASSEKIFAAEKTFASMQLHPRLVQVLSKAVGANGFGFERPTNVQVKSIPAVLSGKDLLVKSETGSGKTLSYLLPVVQKLQAIEPRVSRDDGCLALILAPTRELCLQILETANKLIQPFVYLVPGAIIGGEKKKAEKARLRKGICLLIATPGRLADHLVNTQSFNYSKLQFLVLDEADRLLDMGFEKQITQILSIIDSNNNNSDNDGENGSRKRVKRQNILVSATVNSGVQELAKMSLKKPLMVDADGDNKGGAKPEHENFSTPHQLMQHFILVPAKARLVALTCFLRQELNHNPNTKSKIVVFMSTCDAVDFHYALFGKTAWPASRKKNSDSHKKDAVEADGSSAPAANISSSLFGGNGAVFRLHGNIPQHERMTAFKNFCTSTSGVLLCTDVAARGLNLPTVQWIVQYDPPTETRDYVHRVGRTARSGNQGSSLLFLMPSESEYLDHLQKHGLTMAALSLEKTITRVGKYGGFMRSNKKLPHEVVQSDLQFLYDQTVLADKELFALACQAFHSFVRSYATHTNDTRAIFHVRSLHFGHIAKSFALREPPASSKVRDTGRNAKRGTLQKRKERDEKEKMLDAKRTKKQRHQQRHHTQNVSEFAD